jgi:protein-ribulosamine 3-kinase
MRMALLLFSWLLTAVLSFSPAAIRPPASSFRTTSTSTTSTTSTTTALTMVTADLLDAMSTSVSEALGRDVTLASTSGGGYSGGGGASTSAVFDTKTSTKYFVKAAYGEIDMLRGEYEGVKEMAATNTIRVPKPIAYGQEGRKAFVVFEYLNFCGVGGSNFELGVNLAKMHRYTADTFGFHIDNTIGATPQPNMPRMDDWADFWDTHRLGHMLSLTNNAGYGPEEIAALRKKTRELLSQTPVVPSLLHGDLWGGNKSFAKEEDGTIVPVIFDPATYYGDRETDIAMTYLFGGFSSDFYDGYESEWPLAKVSCVWCRSCAKFICLLVT